MTNRGPDLLVRMRVSALGSAVALSVGMAQSPGPSLKVGQAGDVCCAVDALSILIVVSLIGDRRLKAIIKRFVSEEPPVAHGALRILAKIRLRQPRGATSVVRPRNRHFRS